MLHYSVLKNEIIDYLNIKDSGIYVDATVGYAGDAKEILKKIKKGYLYAFDQDPDACKYSQIELSKISDNFKIIEANFKDLKKYLNELNVESVDGFIFDLGNSSPQIDDEERGNSFMKDGPIDMRMSKKGLSAIDVVNNYSYEKLCEIFFKYGEEKYSKNIAKKIVEYRKNKKISRTLELVDIIKSATYANYFYKEHPERRIFQALRIEVNDELNVLESVLPDAIKMLKKGGRICVITFHSLEDRIVKNIFKKYSEVDNILKGDKDIPDEYKPLIKIINKKPILPSEEELKENSRSHSAKLRVIERI